MVLGTIAAFLPAVTKEEKAKDGCELTKGQKFKNALRKGAPAIALVGTLPTLLEEARASLKANKWTSQLLSPNLAKKAKNANRLGYLTYIFEAIGLVGGAIAAKHFKDSLDKKKEAKQGSQP